MPDPTPPTSDDIAAFLQVWPPGIARMDEEVGATFGLRMRSGEACVFATTAVWTPTWDASEQADAAAAAIIAALSASEAAPIAAAAFVRARGDKMQAGVAVFAFEAGSAHPGADRPDVAQGLFDAVSLQVGTFLGPPTIEPFDALGRFHLEVAASSTGLLLLSPNLRPDDDPAWAYLAGRPHFPSVGFVEEAPDEDFDPE